MTGRVVGGTSHAGRRASALALSVALALATAACGSRVPADSDELLRQGELLYQAQGCIVCHGRAGHGDGPNSRSLNPTPRDFRDLDAYLQGTDANDIADTLSTGVRVRNAQMPAFAHLTERERLALGVFIVSLQAGAD